jgi:hypothetical protein
MCAEAYSCTPPKEIRNLTPRLPKSAVFGLVSHLHMARGADKPGAGDLIADLAG